jgi:preprotein translocase subunit SecE
MLLLGVLMNQVLSSKGHPLLYIVILFFALSVAFLPLFYSLSPLVSISLIFGSMLLGIFSFSRTDTGQKTVQFFSETAKELRKVTWPKKAETRQSVLAVAALVSLAAGFFAVVDASVIKIFEWIIAFSS